MSTVVRAPLRAEFWVGALAVVVGLWLYKNYGNRLPRLPGGGSSC
ncbi:MAG TPA: hypothetical protein VOB72_04080 [Candidatus Dormibacteraeota bacterium]|nr:hypothetical protein [Candidatus Dormibacteraeota bacterium]